MPKPKAANEVWASCGLTLNLGNFESARVDGGISIPLEPGDNPEEVMQNAWDFVNDEVVSQAKDLKASMTKK